jgi:hypothetical protein
MDLKQMKQSITSLKPHIVKAKQFIKANKTTSLAIGFLCLILIGLVFSKTTSGPKFVDKDLGFEVTGPTRWVMDQGKDKKSVSFRKANVPGFENAVIKFSVNYGNPYGADALSYIENGLLRQARYTYEEVNGSRLSLRDEPQNDDRKGRIWAGFSFFIDYNEFQVVYVTQATDQRVFILSLISQGTHQKEDEKAFYKTLDSVEIRNVERPNYLAQ